jgi:hypothetical protein
MPKIYAFSIAILFSLVSLVACKSPSNFKVHTQYLAGTVAYDDPGVPTDAICGECFNWGYTGPLNYHYPLANTDSKGLRTFDNPYFPAHWSVYRYQSARCGISVVGQTVYVTTGTGLIVPLTCNQQPYWSTSPTTFDVHAAPATITFAGDPVVSTAYGMPTVRCL